jgi:excisionase family DNA binding protein
MRLGVSRERVRQIVNGFPNGHRRDDESRKQAVFLRTADVALLLGIHENTVRRWANDGTLKSYRIGKRGDRRFRRDDIERVILEQGNTGNG